MRTEKINGRIVKFYDSIDEMPIVNFQRYNKYLMIDAGIGSDVEDIEAHIMKIADFIQNDAKEKAIEELKNMRMNLYTVANGISHKNKAFAALIHSVDGEVITDYSDENLNRILTSLNQEKQTTLSKFLEWVKKKIDEELTTYFPEIFESALEKEVYGKLKLRTILTLEGVVEDEDKGDQISEIDNSLKSLYKPKAFTGKYSAEIDYDKQFENLCFVIAQRISLDAKKMTVLQFYNAVSQIEEQVRAEKRAYNR